jgi:hypothetical protein
VYAYENDCLRSYVNGDDVWVEQDHIYKLYNSITGAGSGRVTAVPEGEPDVLLDYGEGSTLSIWRVMLTNANHTTSPGLYLLYEGRNGTRYGYDSSKLSTAPLIYLSLIDNRPWSERT